MMKRLSYREKVQLGNEAAETLSKGVDKQAVVEDLRAQGLNRFDVDKVLRTAQSVLRDALGERMQTYMLDGTLEQHRAEFQELDEEDFAKMQEAQRLRIVRMSKAQVSRLAAKGLSQSEIAAQVVNPFFDPWAVSDQIDVYKRRDVKVSGAVKEKYLWLGFGGLILGVGLSIWSYQRWPDGSILFYGLIILGIINLVKAISTHGDIEYMKKQRSNRYGNWFK